MQDLSAIPARRIGGGAGQAVLPHADEHLPDHCRDAGPADHGIAAGLYSQRGFRPRALAESGRPPAGSPAGVGDAAEEVAAAQRPAALFGEPVRGAPVDAETGGPLVPQDELPEVQGQPAARQARPGRATAQPDGPNRAAVRRGRLDQEPDHPRQPPAGRVDRQAARRSRRRTSSSWSATGTCR